MSLGRCCLKMKHFGDFFRWVSVAVPWKWSNLEIVLDESWSLLLENEAFWRFSVGWISVGWSASSSPIEGGPCFFWPGGKLEPLVLQLDSAILNCEGYVVCCQQYFLETETVFELESWFCFFGFCLMSWNSSHTAVIYLLLSTRIVHQVDSAFLWPGKNIMLQIFSENRTVLYLGFSLLEVYVCLCRGTAVTAVFFFFVVGVLSKAQLWG